MKVFDFNFFLEGVGCESDVHKINQVVESLVFEDGGVLEYVLFERKEPVGVFLGSEVDREEY